MKYDGEGFHHGVLCGYAWAQEVGSPLREAWHRFEITTSAEDGIAALEEIKRLVGPASVVRLAADELIHQKREFLKPA